MLVGLGDSPAAACHVVTLGNQLLYKQMLNRSVSILLAPDPPDPTQAPLRGRPHTLFGSVGPDTMSGRSPPSYRMKRGPESENKPVLTTNTAQNPLRTP